MELKAIAYFLLITFLRLYLFSFRPTLPPRVVEKAKKWWIKFILMTIFIYLELRNIGSAVIASSLLFGVSYLVTCATE